MQLFQPCSSPEQSKAIADLSSGPRVSSGVCALASGPGVGNGDSAGSGMTFCEQPTMAQASAANAIEGFSCTTLFLLVCGDLTDASVDSEPLRRDLDLPRPYPSSGMQRFEGSDEHGSEDRHRDPRSGCLQPAAQPCRSQRPSPTACSVACYASRRPWWLQRRLTRGGWTCDLADAIKAYETVRWPNGKIAGGKGRPRSWVNAAAGFPSRSRSARFRRRARPVREPCGKSSHWQPSSLVCTGRRFMERRGGACMAACSRTSCMVSPFADRHAETTIDVMSDACSRSSQFGWDLQRWVALKRLPYLACHPILISARLFASRAVERLLGHAREHRTGNDRCAGQNGFILPRPGSDDSPKSGHSLHEYRNCNHYRVWGYSLREGRSCNSCGQRCNDE